MQEVNTMRFFEFAVIMTIVYASGIVVLARELRASTAEEQRENQTIPLIIAATILYVVVIWKTNWLSQLI